METLEQGAFHATRAPLKAPVPEVSSFSHALGHNHLSLMPTTGRNALETVLTGMTRPTNLECNAAGMRLGSRRGRRSEADASYNTSQASTCVLERTAGWG